MKTDAVRFTASSDVVADVRQGTRGCAFPNPAGTFQRLAGTPRRTGLSTKSGRSTRISEGSKGRVLIVDDDRGTLESFATVLETEGFFAVTAAALPDALELAKRQRYDLVLLDVRLGDDDGLELLKTLRSTEQFVPVVVVTGFASVPLVVEAMRAGALEVIEKPVDPDGLVQVVYRNLPTTSRGAILQSQTSGTFVPTAHAAAHWASAIVRLVDAQDDPRTIAGWAREMNASAGALRNSCHNAGVQPKASLDLARILRAVVLTQRFDIPVHQFFDIADRRTLRKLMRLGGLQPETFWTVHDVLNRQTLVRDPVPLAELEHALQRKGLLE